MINDDNERIISNSGNQIIEFQYPNQEGTLRRVRARVTNTKPNVFFAVELDDSDNSIGRGEDFTYLYDRVQNVQTVSREP